MSTPRHDCKTDDRKLAIDRPCSACSDGDSEMKYHDHCPPFREGVAAPLEPTEPEIYLASTFRHKLDNGKFGVPTSVDAIEKCLLAHAAAVSNNLQEELAAMRTRWNYTLKGEDEALQECRRLEKEIAAQWISVNEKMPLLNVRVICECKDGTVQEGSYGGFGGWFDLAVVRWMPMPKSVGEIAALSETK